MIRVEWQKGKEISDFVRSPLGSHVDRRSPVAEHRSRTFEKDTQNEKYSRSTKGCAEMNSMIQLQL